MEIVVEIVSTVVANWIYGPQRPPIFRIALRAIAFGGATVAVLYAAMYAIGLPLEEDLPLVLVLSWLFCFVTVMSAEYYVGIPWISMVMLVIGLVLLGLLALPHFMSFAG